VLLHTVAGPGAHEQVNIVNVGMALQRSFGRHISTTLRYQWQSRDSNLAGQSYDENRVTFDVLYIF